MTSSLDRAQRVLAIGAWLMMGLIIAGYLTYLPAVNAALDPSGASGSFPVLVLLALVPAAFLACWGGAIWHAVASARAAARPVSSGLLVLLAITGGIGGFFYYFVRGRRAPSRAAV